MGIMGEHGGRHYYVIPCRPGPPVAQNGRLAASVLGAQTREESVCVCVCVCVLV